MKIISRKMIIQKHKHVILFYVERLKFRKKFVSRKSVMDRDNYIDRHVKRSILLLSRREQIL
jgi:hypothetical protein